MIENVDDYFSKGCGRCARFDTPDCSVHLWAGGLSALRSLCQDVALEETVRWGQACYRHAGRNVVILGAFREKFSLNFFYASLMQDPHGLLTPSGPNSKKSTIVFSSEVDVVRLEPILRAYLLESMDYAQRGIKAPKSETRVDMPVELAEALDADPAMQEAFSKLTPGRQRSYLFNLLSAKQSKTRIQRIEKFRPKIFEGKGLQER